MISLLCCSLIGPSLSVPANTAYVEPDDQAARVDRRGVSNWNDSNQSLAWYGKLNATGDLAVSVKLDLPEGSSAHFQMRLNGSTRQAKVVGTAGTENAVFGTWRITGKPAYHKFELRQSGDPLPASARILSLDLSGSASEGAHFNLTERRNAASVHVSYPIPPDAKVEWFFNEIEAKTDPLHTFYMACGFRRGYFGMQVISPTERRIIFSVWDSGNEAIDRDKVAAEDRVQLLAKGDNVVANDFGNEGTGGHSHLVYPWKLGQRMAFLLHAQPSGKTTTYTAFFRPAAESKWRLVASFRAPKDGTFLSGLHSFNENFWGTNGQHQRAALFGPAMARTAEGEWLDLVDGRFSHDGHGKENRKDYYLRPVGERFEMSNGGFVEDPIVLGDMKRRAKSRQKPPTDLPQLPSR